jgi:penicillin-binding protein 2
VNTFFYIAGGGLNDVPGLGIERIVAWARRMGFGDRTGIDLPEEKSGFLPSPAWKEATKGERWYIGDTYHAAIGQGDILVTPLQLASATATIANGGTVYAPTVVDALVRSDGSVFQTLAPEKRAAQVFHPETGALIRRGLRESVLSGSSQALKDLPVAVAGKTGTAQTGTTKSTHAWFTSFAPYDHPELTLTILVEEGGGGERVAVPVAREIYAWYFGGRTTPSPSPPS